MASVTRVSERFRCKTKDCPWPRDAEIHVPWCLHIRGVEHRRDEPWHQHWPKRSQGGKRIVAVLCSYCSDQVDNGYKWGNGVFSDKDGKEHYLLWNVARGVENPLIDRVLEAGNAAATETTASAAKNAGDAMSPTHVAAASPASGESSAAEGQRFLDADDEPLGSGVEVGQVVQPSAAEPSLETWCREGMELVYMGLAFRDATDGLRFAIGDWFNKGEAMMPNEVYGYLRGFEDVTVRQYSWVAERVALDTRVSKLSFTHHRTIAHKEPSEQKELLAVALEKNLNTKEFHRVVHGERPIRNLRCPECGHEAEAALFKLEAT